MAGGCAQRLPYTSARPGPGESTVAYAMDAQRDLSGSIQGGPTANALEAPPFAYDKTLDAATTSGAITVTAPLAVSKPTVRDVPAITVNKSTDLVHDGTIAAARYTRDVAEPTAHAVQRSVTKLGNLFIIRPLRWVDGVIRPPIRQYSVDSYQGALPLGDRRYTEIERAY
jgi:hypothetical protein